MQHENGYNQTDSNIPKAEITIWNILFFILIVIGLVWLFPKLGSYLGERLNRFGLYSQAIGLVSLLPDYFKLKLEKWNPKFQNWAIWLYKRRTEIYYFRTTWDDSIFDEQRKGYSVDENLTAKAGLAQPNSRF